MGYPMTFQRFVSRNQLSEGDYSGPLPHRWAMQVNVDHPGLLSPSEFPSVMWPHAVERLKSYESQLRGVLGDLRRLEKDTVDEGSLCAVIAGKTGIDADTVAAVLQAWLAT